MLLWAVWAIQQYAKEAGNAKCREMYGDLLRTIVDYILADKHPNLRLDDNGLLHSDGRDKARPYLLSENRTSVCIPQNGTFYFKPKEEGDLVLEFLFAETGRGIRLL